MPPKKLQTSSLKEKYASGERKSRHAMEEFGPGKSGFIFCPKGEAVYYKKSWHHIAKFFLNPRGLENEAPRASPWSSGAVDKNIKFKLCPAHEMQKRGQYEGEIIIKNIPVKFRRELANLIENMGERAMRGDIMDRILDLRFKNNDLRVATSENQLAQKIANKIGEVFKKKIDIKISRAKGGDVVRIQVDFVK